MAPHGALSLLFPHPPRPHDARQRAGHLGNAQRGARGQPRLRRPARRRGAHVIVRNVRIDDDIVGRQIRHRDSGLDARDAALQPDHERRLALVGERDDVPGMARPRHPRRATADPKAAAAPFERQGRPARRRDDRRRSFHRAEARFAEQPVGEHGLGQRHGGRVIAGDAQQRDRIDRCKTEAAIGLAHQRQRKARLLHLPPVGLGPRALLGAADIVLVEGGEQSARALVQERGGLAAMWLLCHQSRSRFDPARHIATSDIACTPHSTAFRCG